MLALKKGLKMAGDIIFVLFILVMICIVGFMVKSKLDGGIPKVGPYALYVVLSGSMNPQFNTGSMIAVENASPQNIKVGDIITFKNPEDPKMIITHRVMAINHVNGGLAFTTKGDANDAQDLAVVPAANLIGRAVHWVPYAGYVAEFAKTRKGLLLMIVVPGALILVSEIIGVYRCAVECDEEEKKKKLQAGQDAAAEAKS